MVTNSHQFSPRPRPNPHLRAPLRHLDLEHVRVGLRERIFRLPLRLRRATLVRTVHTLATRLEEAAVGAFGRPGRCWKVPLGVVPVRGALQDYGVPETPQSLVEVIYLHVLRSIFWWDLELDNETTVRAEFWKIPNYQLPTLPLINSNYGRFLRRTLISLLHQSRELRMDFVPEGSVGFKGKYPKC
jgi:hypothetical protein